MKFNAKSNVRLLSLALILTLALSSCQSTTKESTNSETTKTTTSEARPTAEKINTENIYPDLDIVYGDLFLSLPGKAWVKNPDSPDEMILLLRDDDGVNIGYVSCQLATIAGSGIKYSNYKKKPANYFAEAEKMIFNKNSATFFEKEKKVEELELFGDPVRLYHAQFVNQDMKMPARILATLQPNYIQNVIILTFPGQEAKIDEVAKQVVAALTTGKRFKSKEEAAAAIAKMAEEAKSTNAKDGKDDQKGNGKDSKTENKTAKAK